MQGPQGEPQMNSQISEEATGTFRLPEEEVLGQQTQDVKGVKEVSENIMQQIFYNIPGVKEHTFPRILVSFGFAGLVTTGGFGLLKLAHSLNTMQATASLDEQMSPQEETGGFPWSTLSETGHYDNSPTDRPTAPPL